MTGMTIQPVAMRWGASEGNGVAGSGSGAGPGAGKGNQLAGSGNGVELGTGKWAEDEPDCRLDLVTLPTHHLMCWASSCEYNKQCCNVVLDIVFNNCTCN